MTEYERGFSDAIEQAAQKVCIRCRDGVKRENREHSGRVIPCHQHPEGQWFPCSAVDIHLLSPSR